ncbi:hypothetical protein CASFOL_015943 [Castilleja foliolosa]|uniref:Uncharacterized protein n=1 Tax=Castilleja foliolosa TaxID=1961234 RepID=A0ABD3DJE1_9LAMI
MKVKMGSVGGEVESQPSSSNCSKYKLTRTLLVGCGAVSHASVPRKLRSAIKKRARETITSPLSISKKQRHVSNRVGALEKHGTKKCKPKKVHISKDEEEVAETLFAFASIFSESTDMKSSAILATGSSMNAVVDIGMPAVRKESTKTSSVVILESTCHSPNLLDSKAQFVESQSSSGANKKDLIALEQVPASEAQYDNNYKNNGLFQSQTGSKSSETQRSCHRLPSWLENTNFASQPCVNDINISTEKVLVAVQSNKSWKRSSAHIYISRLIKVLQISEKNDEGSPQKPTQLTTVIDDRNRGVKSFNGIMDSAVDKGLCEIQDQPTSALYSSKEGYNFLSLGKEVCGHDQSRGINRAGQSYAVPKQVHTSYSESQNHPSLLFSLPQNGYSTSHQYGDNSALAAQQVTIVKQVQVQFPQYLCCSSTTNNGSFTARMGLQKQKRADQLRDQYNTVGVGSSHLPDWINGKTDSSSTDVNCAQALFPHLLGSTKYQQFIPPSGQQRLMSVDSSSSLTSVKMNQHRQFPFGLERNGRPAFYYGNAQQFLR